MLQVCPQSFSLQGCPYRELMHGIRLYGPSGKLFGVERKLICEFADGLAVVEKQNLK